MPESLVTVAYIVSGLLFIMSLSGLSAQATAPRGNIYGIVGMIIAAVATAFGPRVGGYPTLAGAMAIGSAIGAVMAARVEMTSRSTLAAMAEGDMLRMLLAALRRIMKVTPVNTVLLRRRIADEVVERKAYPF